MSKINTRVKYEHLINCEIPDKEEYDIYVALQLTRIADALESKTCKGCCGDIRRRINRGGK